MSLKYLFELIRAYIKRFRGIISLGVAIGILIFVFIYILLPHISFGNKNIIGITGRYRPNDLPEEILSLIGKGLTKFDGSTLEPDLASSWESQDNGKTWIFRLKDGVFWQDGTKLTSKDINYEFSDVKIERPDDHSLIFTLEKGPYSPFPTVLSKPVFKKGLLGTGEWKVKKISVENTYVQELVLEKDKDNIIYKFYPTVERTKLAYKLGKIDTISRILDPSPFDLWKNTKTSEFKDASQVVTLFFNTKDKLLSDKSIRQALFYAIKKDSFKFRADSPINPNSWTYNPQLKAYDYDTEKAKQLLEKIPDDLLAEEIKLVSTTNLLPLAEKVAADWKEVGLKSQILVSSVIPEEFQVFLTIFDIPDDPDQYPIWHSTQNDTNISKYASPRIDKLLEDGRIEMKMEERRKIYLDFQKYLLEDLPAAFLYHPVYYNINRSD